MSDIGERLDRHIAVAKQRANDSGSDYAVVAMDSGDDRVMRVVSAAYADDPEFEYFEGRVLVYVSPDDPADVN